MDVDGYKGMAGFFPVFFLGVGAFIVSSIVGRIVDAQRGLIGTFMALGVSRRSVLAHYLAHALVLGMVGSVLGAVVGALLGPLLTHEYATELGIPFVSTHVHWGLALSGIGLGAGVAWVAGWLPAWHASRLPPASAMRPPPPATPRLARVGRRLGRAPLALRMAVRNLLGRPTRSLGTAAGVAAALVMVLTTGALLDSMKTTMTSLFVDARRYDLRVDLAVPTAEEEARAQLSSVDGVDEVEPLIVMPATIRAKGREETVELDGLAPDASLQRAMDLDGRVVAVPSGGIVLTRGLGKSLGVALGDEVSVVPIGGERSAKFEVAGFADAAIGKTASARRDDVQARFGFGRTITSVAVRAKDGRARATRSRISELSNVAHIEDLASLRTQMQGLMGLGWAMLGTMLAFSVVLAAAILFNTATLGILERTRELATLRALGRSVRELAVGITIEHAVLCVLGLALGLPIAVVTIRHVLGLYTSDLMTFPFVLSPVTVVVAAVGILFVLGLAQWPALRIVARMSLAETVRSREG
jgi:putative ABC transport system permease protein